MLSKDHKAKYHIVSLIFLDKFYNKPFTSINTKEQILTFLNHQYIAKDGRWVQREYDPDGRCISSFNFYLGLLRIFFRWLSNRDKPEGDWETPRFLKMKTKKPLRDSPYNLGEIWELGDVLTIVQYERVKEPGSLTLLWDANGQKQKQNIMNLKQLTNISYEMRLYIT